VICEECFSGCDWLRSVTFDRRSKLWDSKLAQKFRERSPPAPPGRIYCLSYAAPSPSHASSDDDVI
jgi:hypothetical protein